MLVSPTSQPMFVQYHLSRRFSKKNDSVDPVDRKLSWFFVASQEYCRKASKKVPEAPIRIAWEGAALENSWVFDRDGKIGTFSKKTKNPGMC